LSFWGFDSTALLAKARGIILRCLQLRLTKWLGE